MATHISIKSAVWKNKVFNQSYRPRLFIQTQEGRRVMLEKIRQTRHYVNSYIFTRTEGESDEYYYMIFSFATARRILPNYVGQGVSLAEYDWNDMRPYYAERKRQHQEWIKSLETNGNAPID